MKVQSHISHHTSHILLILLVFGAVLAGCRPRGIMSSRQMKAVLVDMHKTDALIQISGLQYNHDEAQNIYYAQVMEKHGITQAQFDSSIVWYTAHPLFFDKIYPKVRDQLAKERAAFQAEHEEELHLRTARTASKEKLPPRTKAQADSVLWVAQHGYPNSWNELVQDFENQFFPQIGVLR